MILMSREKDFEDAERPPDAVGDQFIPGFLHYDSVDYIS